MQNLNLDSKYETTTRAIRRKLVDGIKDYCEKHNFKDVILGLSGGLDSAVVLALACEALGANHVHPMMLKTKYTSTQSIELAKQATQLNKTDYAEIDIQPIVDSYLKALPFTPKNPVTEQNLQARTRGVILMAYSNDNGWLLPACGNKSEAAMGYCTLYGDVCGGLSPIGDVFKTEVYALANLYNQEGKFFIPQGIIDRPPSAELAHGQKDTDSLPPYSVLDNILKNYIYGQLPVPKEQAKEIAIIRNRYHAMAFKRAQIPGAIRVRE